jgi:hypothetical protein
MSQSNETSWFERVWQLWVIIYALIFTACLVFFRPAL